MDPTALAGIFSAHRNYFRRTTDHTTLVSPSLWLSCYIPFGLSLITSFYVWTYEVTGNKLECLEVTDFPITRVNMECYYEAFTVPKWGYLGIHPGIRFPFNATDMQYRRELPYMQPLFVICGLLFLLPVIMWKYYLAGQNVNEVASLINSEITSRVEDYNHDLQRKLALAADAFQVHYRRRWIFAFSMIACKLLAPLVTVVVVSIFLKVMGDDLLWYGLTAFDDTHTGRILNARDSLFPLYVLCLVRRFNFVGSLTKAETICYYPRNGFYQLMFVVLWWVLAVQLIAATVGLVVETLFLASSTIRRLAVIRLVPKSGWDDLERVLKRVDLSGYLYLTAVVRNTDPGRLPSFLSELHEAIDDAETFWECLEVE